MKRIMMAHGSGGRLSHELISTLFQKYLGNSYLDQMNDATVLPGQAQIAVTTDSFVISPLFSEGEISVSLRYAVQLMIWQ